MAVHGGVINQATSQLATASGKLRPPRLTGSLVPRQGLMERLERGLTRRLTLVAAPAGFGKTTMLATWAASGARPVAWLTLDETDDGREPFLRSLVAALRTIESECGQATLRLLELPPPLGSMYQARVLADDLVELGRELVVVLDDYHALQDPTIHELVAGLLRELPEHVHLVVSAREDPPLPLARLRARDELTELRAEELRFSPVEARAFVDRTLGPGVDNEVVTELEERTEGWAAGLRLATLALRDRSDRLEWVRSFSGDQQHIRAFLADEVLARQDEDVCEFLLATAILGRVCAPLGEALVEWSLPPGASQAVLERITRANLFVVALDAAGVWFRYDRLFREALLHRLQVARGEEYVRALHLQARDWFAAEGLLGEAIHHALAGGDLEAAARLVEDHAHALLDREDWPSLEACLRALPAELVNRWPGLVLARCWVLQVRMAYASLPSRLLQAEQLLSKGADGVDPSATAALRAEVDALRGVVSLIRGDLHLAQECGWRALQGLPATFDLGRRNAATAWAIASQLLGEGETALAWLRREVDARLEDPEGNDLQLAGVPALVYLLRGEYPALEQTLRPVVARAERAGFALTAGWGHYLLGRVHYLRDELAEARERFGAALAMRHRANGLVLRESLLGLALCHQELGHPDAARGALGTAKGIAAELPGFDPQDTLAAAEWRLALLRGERVDVPRGAPPGQGESILTLTSLGVECPTLTRARALLTAGDRAALAEAETLADWLVMRLAALHDPARLAAALALRALVRHAHAEITAAQEDLKRAVELGQPSGLVRPFVELGAPLAGLLAELIARLPLEERAYPERLLAAFPPASGPSDMVLPSRHHAEDQLAEPLTWREMEVLELLEERLTNKEIAQALTISPETVKKHVANICQKLQVENRRQAVARGRVLGLLTRPGARAP